METTRFLKDIAKLPGYRGQIVHRERLPARRARYGKLDRPLPPAVESALRSAGVSRLYTHQAMAINAIDVDGEDADMVVTADMSDTAKLRDALAAMIKEERDEPVATVAGQFVLELGDLEVTVLQLRCQAGHQILKIGRVVGQL